MITNSKKTFRAFGIILTLFFIFNAEVASATDGFGQWGTAYYGSSGSIQTVSTGYGLTAIGYGSDDHQCVIGIKTAPILSGGSVDFSNIDSTWQMTTCANGAPGSSRTADQKYFQPSSGYVVTGWNWGANTSGGIPGNDSIPADECFFQQYTNLTTGQVYGWGTQYDGTCNERGYAGLAELKAVAFAPAGRVIVGILFNIDNDAKLESLAMTTRDIKTAELDVSYATNEFSLTPTDTSGTGQISNINATNGGSFTVGPGNCGYIGGTLSNFNISVQCPDTTGDFDISVINGPTSPGTYTANIQIFADGDDTTIVANDTQVVPVTYTVPSGPPPPGPDGQIDIKCDGGDTLCTISQGSVGNISWGPVAGNTAYSGCVLSRDSVSLGARANSGSEGTPVNSVSSDTTYTYSMTCNKTAGGTTTDSVQVKFLGTFSCQLTANGSTSNLTVSVNSSVAWAVNSTPSGFPYFWHVTASNGVGNANDTPGGSTNWSGSYFYNTPGTYDVYFHAEKGGNHSACTSNTITLTVAQTVNGQCASPPNGSSYSSTPPGPYCQTGTASAISGTGPWTWQCVGSGPGHVDASCSTGTAPPSGFSCSAPADSTAPYQTHATVTGLPGYNYNWTTPCTITNSELNDGFGGSKHWIDVTCPSPAINTFTVTEAATGRFASCNFNSCPSGGCAPPDPPPPPAPPASLEAATNGSQDNDDPDLYYGTFSDPLNGPQPMNGIDFRMSYPSSVSLVGVNTTDIYCDANDLSSPSASVNGPVSWVTQHYGFNVCNYPSPGTYTALARGVWVDLNGNHSPGWCITGSCEDTVTIVVAPVYCPSGSVQLSSSQTSVGGTVTASAPAGFSGGSFASTQTSKATVSGSTVTGVAEGLTNITGSGWTYTNGATSCSLSLAPLTVIRPTYSVTVTKTTGGTVTSSDGGINCGTSCSSGYVKDSIVTLTPTPLSSYWKFQNWTGDCTGSGQCVLTITSAKNAHAIFVPRQLRYEEF